MRAGYGMSCLTLNGHPQFFDSLQADSCLFGSKKSGLSHNCQGFEFFLSIFTIEKFCHFFCKLQSRFFMGLVSLFFRVVSCWSLFTLETSVKILTVF